MTKLQPKTTNQLFEATVNLEFDYFISQLEDDMSISDFGTRISIKDTSNNGLAFYFDNSCIFTVTPPGPEESAAPLPRVERFYLTNKVRLCEQSEPQSEPFVGTPALTSTIQ